MRRNVQDMAKLLGVTRPTVYHMIADGRLPPRDVSDAFWSEGLVERIMADPPALKSPGRPKGSAGTDGQV